MPRPNTSPVALRRILQQELALGKRLLALTQEESDVIVRNDVPRLTALQAEQQRCLAEQNALEQARALATRDLAWAVGMERPPTLSGLIAILPVREQSDLRRLRADLLALHQQMEIVQARNRRLIDSALEYARFSLELLTGAALQPARYGTNLARLYAPTFYIDSKA
jgi:hypothetical protein